MVKRSVTWLAVTYATAVLFSGSGCAETAKLRGGIDITKKKLAQIEQNGAYICAPRELAVAKAHLRFAEIEIKQGHGSRAQRHFEIATQNAELADEKSPPDKCAGPAVVVADCLDLDGDGICDDQDLDGDGITDGTDQCLLDPEDKDDYLDDDGCPDIDNDADGVLDVNDKCINEPEDPDGFEDEDGCPDLDNDADTVLDVDDECPNEPGDVENKGCPKKYEGVEITDTHIRINQKIHFAYNKAKIKKDSYWILDQVVKVLNDYPNIKLSIEGHTDSTGGDRYNLKLSKRRARAVMRYLQKKDISQSRLTSQGFGETRPIDTNKTDEGRAANRRVEFVRTDVSPKE
jgi:outer membrane protein OmpA-like peptidoglycan-associated protein